MTFEIKKENCRTETVIRVYLSSCDMATLYRDSLIRDDGRCKTPKRECGYKTIDTNRLVMEVVADWILQNDFHVDNIKNEIDYGKHKGSRPQMIAALKERKLDFSQQLEYINTKKAQLAQENRLAHILRLQKTFDEFCVLDYQVPKSRGDHAKIDIVLQDKNDNLYIVELKTQNSKESLLRCVLGIATYARQINQCAFKKEYGTAISKIIPAIMTDKDSWAYQQYQNKEDNPKVIALLKHFGIRFLLFNQGKDKFIITDVTRVT